MMMIFLPSKVLKVSENIPFTIGESATLTCTSVIPVDELVWLDQGSVLVNVSSNDTSEISAYLTFNQVNDSIHNSTFTCVAKLKNGTVEKDIFVSATGNINSSFNPLSLVY